MQAPERSKISGFRAEKFGDLWFIDHVDISVKDMWDDGKTWERKIYVILIVLDGATHLINAFSQKNKDNEVTIAALLSTMDKWQIRPRAIVADAYFHEQKFMQFYGSIM